MQNFINQNIQSNKMEEKEIDLDRSFSNSVCVNQAFNDIVTIL